jgi:hypothetical protein
MIQGPYPRMANCSSSNKTEGKCGQEENILDIPEILDAAGAPVPELNIPVDDTKATELSDAVPDFVGLKTDGAVPVLVLELNTTVDGIALPEVVLERLSVADMILEIVGKVPVPAPKLNIVVCGTTLPEIVPTRDFVSKVARFEVEDAALVPAVLEALKASVEDTAALEIVLTKDSVPEVAMLGIEGAAPVPDLLEALEITVKDNLTKAPETVLGDPVTDVTKLEIAAGAAMPVLELNIAIDDTAPLKPVPWMNLAPDVGGS